MTAASFIAWLASMRAAGLARSEIDCGRQLGISADTVVRLKQSGTDVRTALACSALLNRLKPYVNAPTR